MFKSTKEFDAAAVAILSKIRDGKDHHSLESQFGKADFDDAFEFCIQQGFVHGLRADRMADGSLTWDIIGEGIRITRDGLQFIERFQP